MLAKDEFKTGDLVAFAPKRSVLPPDIRKEYSNPETGVSYLHGPNCDRVGSIRLRGQQSEGVLLPLSWVKDKFGGRLPAEGVDLSETLGITEYLPGTPSNPHRKWGIQGDIVQNVKDVVELQRFCRHDVESYFVFKKEFIPGEFVSVTEKIHGSQINIIKDKFGKVAVTSKGRAEKNLVLREYPVSRPFVGTTLWAKVKSAYKWIHG